MTSSQRWYRFFPSDWLSRVGELSPEERGVLLTLVCLMFDRGAALPRDDARLARLCGMTASAFRKALAALLDHGKVIENEGLLSTAWVTSELENATEKSEAASKSANARWGKNTNKINAGQDALALRPHTERICETACETDATQNQNISPIGPLQGHEVDVDLSSMSGEIRDYASQGITRAIALTVRCQHCGAQANSRCLGTDGKDRRSHIERYQLVAAQRAAPKPSTVVDWPGRLRAFEEHGTWPHVWGPKPGEAGCKAQVAIDQDDPLVPIIRKTGHPVIVGRSGKAWLPLPVVEHAKALAGAA